MGAASRERMQALLEWARPEGYKDRLRQQHEIIRLSLPVDCQSHELHSKTPGRSLQQLLEKRCPLDIGAAIRIGACGRGTMVII